MLIKSVYFHMYFASFNKLYLLHTFCEEELYVIQI
jgi:hypothetical protein